MIKNQTFSTGRVMNAVAVAATNKTTRVYLKKENQLKAIETNVEVLIKTPLHKHGQSVARSLNLSKEYQDFCGQQKNIVMCLMEIEFANNADKNTRTRQSPVQYRLFTNLCF